MVNIRTVSTVFQAQIYTTGTIIYSANDTFLKKLQMTALRLYAKLNKERQGIIKILMKGGTIYEK
ncbi:hypothetical protein BIV59_17405 [Bacillus sp. MUM 13]|nr:hypothetical protein BIV59_17405 [Bacillus sp. MUM 13]